MILYEILGLLLFASVCIALMAGFPVAFTLGGVSLIFALGGAIIGAFDLSFLGFISNRIYGVMTNEVLIAVPGTSGVNWVWANMPFSTPSILFPLGSDPCQAKSSKPNDICRTVAQPSINCLAFCKASI